MLYFILLFPDFMFILTNIDFMMNVCKNCVHIVVAFFMTNLGMVGLTRKLFRWYGLIFR